MGRVQGSESGSSPGPRWLPRRPECHPTHRGAASARPGRGRSRLASFVVLRDGGRLEHLLGQLSEEVAPALQATSWGWKQKLRER